MATRAKPTMITAKVHRGDKGGYAIVADGYPLFAFGKSHRLAHVRFVGACYAYFGKEIKVGRSIDFEQPIYAK